jgi:hypothetical protein
MMKNRIWLAILLALLLASLTAPAFAQEPAGDKFCAGGSATVDAGTTVRNLTLFGCSGSVRSGGTVTNDAVVVGGSLHIEQGAHVNHNVAVIGGSVAVDGEIGGDVSVAGGSVTLSDTAVVNGNVRIAGGSIQRAGGATVRGTVSQENNPRFPVLPRPAISPFPVLRPFFGGFDFLRSLFSAIALAALGAVLVVLFPAPVRRVSDTAQHSFVPSVGVGCLTLVIAPFILVALAITIIGIPLVVLLAIAGAAAWYFGWITIGCLAGERILLALNARNVTPVLAAVVGVLLIALIGNAPVVGGIVSALVGLLGLGAVILTRFGTRPYPHLATAMALPGPAPVPASPSTVVSPASAPRTDEPVTPEPPASGTQAD